MAELQNTMGKLLGKKNRFIVAPVRPQSEGTHRNPPWSRLKRPYAFGISKMPVLLVKSAYA